MDLSNCPIKQNSICLVACPAAEMAVIALLEEHNIIQSVPYCDRFSGIADEIKGDERFFQLEKSSQAVRCFSMVAESFTEFKPGRRLYSILPDGSKIDLCQLSLDQIEEITLQSNIIAIFDAR
ncbi:hypothetical protein OPS25_04955 [Alteromonas ponticola]|uniref:Uncharacterized protein n=1 Tax=Alteromonas aquimaris TaxID=2998417 RepID=A0ABT3P504_9ALTE|nr:hypothetical protein [Alteromonas aquimaris]MCW8107845.1 hypothetical protein [Alteromonas aquimaris]